MENVSKCAVCKEPAQHHCSACKKVSYCSKEHQKADWKKHKKDCVPYKICHDDKLGYHLVAARKIEEGSILVEDEPFVVGSLPCRGTFCLSCLEPLDLDSNNFRNCRKCDWPLCTKEDCHNYQFHERECYYIMKRKANESLTEFQFNNMLYDGIIILRCLYLKQFEPNNWENFMKLRSGGEKIKTSKLYDPAKKTLVKIIHNSFGLKDEFSEEDIMKVWAILEINGYPLRGGKEGTALGSIIYEMSSYFENNCKANCYRSVRPNGVCIITAGRNIAEGEHLTLCYARSLYTTIKRQRYLQNNNYFICRCERCTDVTEFGTNFSSYKCQRKNCDGISLPESFLTEDSQWTCNKCRFKTQATTADKYFKHGEQALAKIKRDTPDSAAYRKFLDSQTKLFPETHSLIIRAKFYLIFKLGDINEGGVEMLSDEDIKLKKNLFGDVISILDIIAPAQKPFKIEMVLELRVLLREAIRRLDAATAAAESSNTIEERKSIVDKIEQLLKKEEKTAKLFIDMPEPEHSLQGQEEPEQTPKFEEQREHVFTDIEESEQSEGEISLKEEKDEEKPKHEGTTKQVPKVDEKSEQPDNAEEVPNVGEKTEQEPKDEENPQQATSEEIPVQELMVLPVVETTEKTQKCAVCKEPAERKCSACRKVFYCSKEHQETGWKKHKEDCVSYKICHDDKLGYYLVAARKIEEGKQLVEEIPFILGPRQGGGAVCLSCLKPLDRINFRKCRKCDWRLCNSEYCHNDPRHQPECYYITKRKADESLPEFQFNSSLYDGIMILRCLYQKQFRPDLWDKFIKLRSGGEKIKKATLYNSAKNSLLKIIHNSFGLKDEFSEEDIMKVWTILRVNEYPLGKGKPPVASVIFEMNSYFENNCRANCYRSVTTDVHCIIVAGKAIAKGEHLTLCYARPLSTTINRQLYLQQKKYFTCRCERCTDVTEFGTNFSSYKCQRENCGGILLPESFLTKDSQWTCSKCKSKMPATTADKIFKRVEQDYDKIEDTSAAYKTFIENHIKLLPETHSLIINAKLSLITTLGCLKEGGVTVLSDEDITFKDKLCKEVLNLLDIIAPAERNFKNDTEQALRVLAKETIRRSNAESSNTIEERKSILDETKQLLLPKDEEQGEQVLTDTVKDEEELEMSLKEEGKNEEKPKHQETTKQVPKVEEKSEQSDNAEKVPKAGAKTEQEPKDEEQVPTSEEIPIQGSMVQTCAVCKEPAELSCSECQKVFYCSEEHQETAQKKHKKKYCVSYNICNDDKLGYHLVAKRNIKKGTKIVEEDRPFIIGPPQGGGVVCLSCLKPIDTAHSCKCSKCGWVLCNSERCRNSRQHDPECYYTRKRRENESLSEFQFNDSLYDGIIMLRCLYWKQFAPTLWEKLMKLRSGGDKIKRTTQYKSAKEKLLKIIHNSFGLKDEFAEEEIMKVWAILQINGEPQTVENAVATVIYEMSSYFENNCSPNCYKTVTKEGNCIIMALKSITKGDHLTLCYTHPLSSTIERQRFLKKNKYFTCRCERCTDVTEFGTNFSSYKCPARNCDGILLPESFLTRGSPWTCNTCKLKNQARYVGKIHKQVEQDLKDITEDNSAVYKAFLARHKESLPESNHFIITAKISLAYALGHALEGGMVVLSHEDVGLKKDLCKEIIKLIDIIAPAEKSLRTDMLEGYEVALDDIDRRYHAARTFPDSSLTIEEQVLTDTEGSEQSEGEISLKCEEELEESLKEEGKDEEKPKLEKTTKLPKAEAKSEQSQKGKEQKKQVLTHKEKTQESENAEEIAETEEKTEQEVKDDESPKQVATSEEKPEQGLMLLRTVTTTKQTGKCAVCEKPTERSCPACHKVFYCSAKHQRTGWKKHKKDCVPYKICNDDKLGYRLVATRKIEEGEEVVVGKPFVLGPRQKGGIVCLSCLKPIDTNNACYCSKCGWELCNSEACRNSKHHDPECYYTVKRKANKSLTQFQYNSWLYDGIMVLRCLFQKQFAPGYWERFMKLKSGGDKIKKTALYESAKSMLLKIIHNSFGLKDEFSEEDIMKVWAILKVNGYQLSVDKGDATVIYEMTSYFENNCRANCHKIDTKEGNYIIIAGKNIAEGDHLTLCHAPPLSPTINRQRYLQQNKYFTCRCERCTDVTEFGTNFSAFKCQQKNCDGISLPETFLTKDSQWTCNKCKFKTPATSADKMFKHVEQDWNKITQGTCAVYKSFWNRHKRLLPETHSFIIIAKLNLALLLGREKKDGMVELSDEDITLKTALCIELLQLLYKIAPAEKKVRINIILEHRAVRKETNRRLNPAGTSADSSITIEEHKSILDETEQILKSEEETEKLIAMLQEPCSSGVHSLKCEEQPEQSEKVEDEREQVITDTKESEQSEGEKSLKVEEELEMSLKEEGKDEEKLKHEETTKQVPMVEEKFEQLETVEEHSGQVLTDRELLEGEDNIENSFKDEEKPETSQQKEKKADENLKHEESTKPMFKIEEKPEPSQKSKQLPTTEEKLKRELMVPQKCDVCKKPAELQCSACRKVFYCGKEHQNIGWEKHKENCIPYKICSDDKLGYHLVATQNIEKGKEIFQEMPFIIGPQLGGGAVCLSCLKPIDLTNFRTCIKCGWLLCGYNACHNNPDHQPECYYTTKRKANKSLPEFQFSSELYDSIIILRCLYQKQFAPALWEKLMKLRSGGEKIKRTTLYHSAKTTLLEIIHDSFGLRDEFSEEEIMKIWAILKINEYQEPSIKSQESSTAVASIIYEMHSYLVNNCRANCYRTVTEKGCCIIIAGKNIAEGEHLTLRYADPLWTTTERQRYLKQNKYFICRCERCTDVTEFGTNFSSYKCRRKNCDGISLPESFLTKDSQWTCNKCKFKTEASVAEEIFKRVKQNFDKIEVFTTPIYKEFLERHKKLLPETHSFIINAKLRLIATLGDIKEVISREDIILQENLCRKVINVLDIIAPAEKDLEMKVVQALQVLLKETTKSAEEINTITDKTLQLLNREKPEITRTGRKTRKSI